tara:strand:- start:2249 stop:2728 length:480 start_codon:yes stop_codon:yes gene_type:complete
MSQKRVAIFPGSFDPITKGHQAVLIKALPLFDEIIIAIGLNSTKKNLFSVKERTRQLQLVFKSEPKVSVESFDGLTIEFCKKMNANFLIRGLRDSKDFEYEKSIAIMNNQIEPSIETVFFITDVKYQAINSLIIRDILRNNGDASKFLPNELNEFITGA